MKQFLLFILLVVICSYSNAQAPNWLWAEDGLNGSSYEYGWGVSVDTSGHVFLSGRCAGTMTFGGKTVTAGGADSPIMGEFDSLGNAIWLKEQTYSGGYDYIFGFGLDSKGNTYGIGTVSSGSTILLESYNSSGTLRWTKQFGGYGSNGFEVAADNSGSIYITGNMSPGTYTLGSFNVTYAGSGSAILLAKLDSNGNFIWAKSIYGTGAGDGTDDGRDIMTDNKGNIYFCGNYSGSPVFDNDTAPASTGYSNFYIAKYDTAGNEEQLITASNASTWSSNFGGLYGATHALTMDSCGNYFVTGMIRNTANFDSLSVTSLGTEDIFVAKCSNSGKWQWVSTAGSSGVSDHGYAIALDKNNDVYASGQYAAAINFGGGATLSGAGIYVVKYANSTGQPVWAQSASSNSELLLGLAVDKNRFAYITGSIGNTSTFGAISLTPPTNQDIFLAKLDSSPTLSIVPVVNSGYCPGSTVTIPYTVSGNFISGNTFTAQLSDSNGSFIKAVTVGSTISTANGTITITIPANTPPGSNYLIRIVSSNPAYCSYTGCFGFTIGNNLSASVVPVNDTLCSGGSVTIKASGGSGATYLWNTNETADSIIVSPTSNSTYTVLISNGGCSVTDTSKVVVNTVLPLQVYPPGASICSGQTITLKVSVSGSDYVWTPSTSLSATTGDSVVANPTTNITYTVTGLDSLGCSVNGTEAINVGQGPNQPTIIVSVTGDTLFSSAVNGNQWYVNRQPISGATDSFFVISGLPKGDTVKVAVTDIANGCSTTSDAFITGIDQLTVSSGQLTVYPNPTNGIINVTVNSSAGEMKDWNLRVIDVLGRTLYTRSSLTYYNEIDLSALPGGVYFITLINKTGRAVVPVVKQN